LTIHLRDKLLPSERQSLKMTKVHNSRADLSAIQGPPADNKTAVIPALPGFYAIDLLPLSDGGFDPEHVFKTPVVAWSVEDDRAVPIIPGLPLAERWAVLTPNGIVLTDEFTSTLIPTLALKDWIQFEIEFIEIESKDGPFEPCHWRPRSRRSSSCWRPVERNAGAV
jgi:hypothetical protein